MCGLFGIFSPKSARLDRNAFEGALKSIQHRGPDALGALQLDQHGIIFGHARLSIIDLHPRSDQPFVTGSNIVIFNGEIYNYRTLRAELSAAGMKFETDGDTEVIARGYELWGKGVFERLQGMYAIALLDLHSGQIHLTRDLFGIKPLYFCEGERGEILFASEIKPMLRYRRFAPNVDTIVDLCSWGFHLSHDSCYQGISQLKPGTVVTLSRADRKIQISVADNHRLHRLYAQEQSAKASNELGQTLSESVRDHLIADVPVAVALSGGLDSSTVAALAAHHKANLTAFTLTLSRDRDAEVEHAAAVCTHWGLKHQVVRLEVNDLGAMLARIAYHLEEPVVNINAILTYGLSAAVRQAGFKVMLMGEGGDELFAGYPWYALSQARNASLDPRLLFSLYKQRRAQKSFLKYLRPGLLPLVEKRMIEQENAFTTLFGEQRTSTLNQFLYFDQLYQLQFSQLLRVDRMTMAHGIEARVPFLYESVADVAARLRDHEKIKTRWYQFVAQKDKLALRKVARNLLPASVAMRPKFGARGTVNLWDTGMMDGLDNLFMRAITSEDFALARSALDTIFDWEGLRTAQISKKEKFAIVLIMMTTAIHVCGLNLHEQADGFSIHDCSEQLSSPRVAYA